MGVPYGPTAPLSYIHDLQKYKYVYKTIHFIGGVNCFNTLPGKLDFVSPMRYIFGHYSFFRLPVMTFSPPPTPISPHQSFTPVIISIFPFFLLLFPFLAGFCFYYLPHRRLFHLLSHLFFFSFSSHPLIQSFHYPFSYFPCLPSPFSQLISPLLAFLLICSSCHYFAYQMLVLFLLSPAVSVSWN